MLEQPQRSARRQDRYTMRRWVELLECLGPTNRPVHLLTGRAHEGNETHQLALDLEFILVVPPLGARLA